MSDELDEIRRYVSAIDPPDPQTVADVKSRLRVPLAASGRGRAVTRPHKRLRAVGWVGVGFVVVALAVALLAPTLGHSPPAHNSEAPVRHHLAQLLVDDVNVTVASGNYDMTFNDTTTPPTQCAQTGGSQDVGGSAAGSGATAEPCLTPNSLPPQISTESGLSSISGHGTVDTNPYAMVTVSDVGYLGMITLYDNGTSVWEMGGGDYGLSAPGTAGPGAPLSGYTSSVEGTVGQLAGALDMQGLASGTGYLNLEAQEIQGAQPAGTSMVDGVPVTVYKLSESGLQDPNLPGLTTQQSETISAADDIIKSSGFAGKTTWISVDEEGYIREQKTEYTLPDGSAVTADTVLSNFGCAGTVLMPGQAGTSAPPVGCVSPDTAGAPTRTTTPSTSPSTSRSTSTSPSPSTPTTGSPPTPTTVPTPSSAPPAPATACVDGSAAVTVDTSDSSVCMDVGATLTVTFDDSDVSPGAVGGWIGQPQSDDSAVAALINSSSSGTHLVATVRAVAIGTATVSASFAQGCTSGDATPCTIPPQRTLRLVITVAG